jgi:Flp pilus assembly protein TadD
LAEYGICRHGKPLIRSQIDYIWLSLPVFLGIYVVIDLASGQGPLYHYVQPGYSTRDFTLNERLLTQPRVILFYLSQIIWPNPANFSIEHAFTLSKGLFEPPETIIAILTIIGWIVTGVVLLLIKSYRLWGFCILWLPLTLAIESSAVALEMVFEHRMYMPLIGLAGLASLSLAALSRHRKHNFILAAMGVGIFNIACLIATLQRVPDWQSRTILSESALQHAPNSPRVLATLASAYALTGRLEESADAAQSALEQDPGNPYALEALGIVYMDTNQLEQAEHYFSHAYKGFGPKDQLLNHWGELKVKRGLYQEAHTLFSWAIRARPWIATYHWNIAVTYEHLNQCVNARVHWEKFLKLSDEEEARSEVRAHLAEVHDSATGKCAGSQAP